MTRRISRRRAIQYAAAAAAALAIPSWLAADSQEQPGTVELPQPQVLKSANGELSLTLTAMPGVVDMGAGGPVTTYTYDNVVPGYTWEINPGDTLKVDLVNKLPSLRDHPPATSPLKAISADLAAFRCPLPLADYVSGVAASVLGGDQPPALSSEWPGLFNPPRPHQWTNTNLHTHGLHVSPSGNADNIFLDIAPGEAQSYEIALPQDHPGGMFWYHPHRHGAVAQQVRAGMAGALIVRGDIDEVEEVRAAKEQVMVLQAIELGRDYQLLDPIPAPTSAEAFYPRTQILYTVNGVLTPKISMYPGEVQRWRLLNAAEGKFLTLRLEGHGLNILAWDGLNLAAPDAVENVLMAAGNRVELLVQAGEPGSYQFILTPSSSARAADPGLPDIPAEFRTRSIATIVVAGTGPKMRLPTSLPAFDPPILPIARTRYFEYTVARQPDDTFLSFGVNGIPFDPDRLPYQMKLGTAEEWTLVNAHDHKLARHEHGFHIHTNPFKVTKINGVALATPLWRDTFVLTGDNADSVTFVSNFVDYTGKFVEHCHILTHEDLGMMESLEVIP